MATGNLIKVFFGMLSDPTITSAPPDAETLKESIVEHPHVKFSGPPDITRLLYRRWTRIAVHLFPENSVAERVAQKLHIRLPDKLNLSWIADSLAVGGRIHPADIKALARIGVTHVVDTRAECCDDAQALTKEHIELLHLPTADTYPLTVEQLMRGTRWVSERLKQGGRVLIHCEHGVGRSVLLTCAVLVYDGLHAQDALQLVQEKRWQAAPNHQQVVRLREFEKALDAQQTA